jgi:hypothetical protein
VTVKTRMKPGRSPTAVPAVDLVFHKTAWSASSVRRGSLPRPG